MYGNQHVWRGSRQSIQTLAVMSLIALAACVPRSGDILKISNEVGKVSKNVQALVEAETGSYGRSLRLIYGRELLERDVVSYSTDQAPDTENQSDSKLFAHFACAGIPIDSNDADMVRTLAWQNKALAAFHSALEKAAKRAEKDAKVVEAVSTNFLKNMKKKNRLEPYSHSEAPTFSADSNIFFGKPGLRSESLSKHYSQCFNFAKSAYELKASDDVDTPKLGFYSFSPIATFVGLEILSKFVFEGVRDSALISEVRAYLDQNEWKIRESLVVNASGKTTKLEFDEIKNAGGDAYPEAYAAYVAAVKVYNAELLPTPEPDPDKKAADPDKVEKAFGDLEKAAAALLKSSTGAEEIKDIVEAHDENKAQHAANFATILYLAACKAASDCEQKVYNKGISNNHFLLNAMMTRRGAALMVPAIRFDYLLRFDEVVAKDKATLVVGLHDSFAEFDTLRGTGLTRNDLKKKLVRISTGMSANIRELRKLTESAAYYWNLDGDEIVNEVRRLAISLEETLLSLEEFATSSID